jgi:hypothetical protein
LSLALDLLSSNKIKRKCGGVYAQVVSSCRVFLIAGCFDFKVRRFSGLCEDLCTIPNIVLWLTPNGEFHFDSVITPFADATSLIYANSGYLPAGDYWRLGMIFAAIFLGVLLLLGLPWAGILWAR